MDPKSLSKISSSLNERILQRFNELVKILEEQDGLYQENQARNVMIEQLIKLSKSHVNGQAMAQSSSIAFEEADTDESSESDEDENGENACEGENQDDASSASTSSSSSTISESGSESDTSVTYSSSSEYEDDECQDERSECRCNCNCSSAVIPKLIGTDRDRISASSCETPLTNLSAVICQTNSFLHPTINLIEF